MGGDTGGNDCVHVIDVPRDFPGRAVRVKAAPGSAMTKKVDLYPTTQVVIHDEHGNVCQFTLAEWDAFLEKMVSGRFDGIGQEAQPQPGEPGGACATCGMEIVFYRSPSGMMSGWNHAETPGWPHPAAPPDVRRVDVFSQPPGRDPLTRATLALVDQSEAAEFASDRRRQGL